MVTYIAVHGGAGVHNRSKDAEAKESLRLACRNALRLMSQESARALIAVESAVSTLEDSPYFNAGYGSNLTLRGSVECDASIMDGFNGDFGGVGAVAGVKNPIKLALKILEHSRVPDRLGRIPPLTLVGLGARSFAASTALRLEDPADLISSSARDEWQRWITRQMVSNSGALIPEPLDISAASNMQDTVGAVACDDEGHLASGVSSGGLLLKHSGRIGEAAIFGAGCWANQGRTHGMACSLSGAGEYIIRTQLARAIGLAWAGVRDSPDAHEILHRVLSDDFVGSCRSRGCPDANVGVLLLTKEDEGDRTRARLWCAFTTESMAIAYASSDAPEPKAVILRRPKHSPIGENSIFITALLL